MMMRWCCCWLKEIVKRKGWVENRDEDKNLGWIIVLRYYRLFNFKKKTEFYCSFFFFCWKHWRKKQYHVYTFSFRRKKYYNALRHTDTHTHTRMVMKKIEKRKYLLFSPVVMKSLTVFFSLLRFPCALQQQSAPASIF